MQTYIAVVDKDPSSAYGVWFPDVPGCFSAADTSDALFEKATEALSLHIDPGDVPQARTIDALRSDPEVTQALRDGAYLLAIPYFLPTERIVRANISIDQGSLLAIDETARQRGMTRSAFMTKAAIAAIQGKL